MTKEDTNDEVTEHVKPIEWSRDPAASGWRSRLQLEYGECLAYDDGR